jgi:hypothetical protein
MLLSSPRQIGRKEESKKEDDRDRVSLTHSDKIGGVVMKLTKKKLVSLVRSISSEGEQGQGAGKEAAGLEENC